VQFVGAGLESLTIKGGSGRNTFKVIATGAGYTTSLQDGSADDIVNVGSRVLPPGGVVDNLHGLLSVTNAAGGADVMNVDDTGSTAGKVGTLTQSRLTGLGMAQGIQYSGLAAVNIRLGTGGDTFTVASTHTGTTFVAAGPGDDTVDVQSTSGP